MCSRFSMDIEDEQILPIDRLEELYDIKYHDDNFPKGDVFPGQMFPVLIDGEEKAQIQKMKWGFTNKFDKKRIINAKSETIHEKPMFSFFSNTHRCIIVCKGFYEWKQDETHQKYFFEKAKNKALFFAGIYDDSSEGNFVILTKKANESIQEVHHRMPVILEQDQILGYLRNNLNEKELFFSKGPSLIKEVLE